MVPEKLQDSSSSSSEQKPTKWSCSFPALPTRGAPAPPPSSLPPQKHALVPMLSPPGASRSSAGVSSSRIGFFINPPLARASPGALSAPTSPASARPSPAGSAPVATVASVDETPRTWHHLGQGRSTGPSAACRRASNNSAQTSTTGLMSGMRPRRPSERPWAVLVEGDHPESELGDGHSREVKQPAAVVGVATDHATRPRKWTALLMSSW